MKYNYYSFQLISTDMEGATELTTVFEAGDLTLYSVLRYDTDETSDTYHKWIMTLEPVSDEEDLPERSLIMYPNTLHFDNDELYTLAVVIDAEEITYDNISDVYINIGVPINE